MGAPRVDGAGLLPPRVNPRNHLAPAEAAPNAQRPRGRQVDRGGEGTATVETHGWQAADEAYAHHEIGLRRKNRWSGFQGRRQGWANAPTSPGMLGPHGGAAPFRAPDKMLGEPALNYFMRFSAALNEYYRAHGERVGVSMYGFTAGNEPGSILRRARFRRRFALR